MSQVRPENAGRAVDVEPDAVARQAGNSSNGNGQGAGCRLGGATSALERRAGRDWLARSWTLTHPFGTGGVYPNFPDPDLENPGLAYYGENYERLLRIKAHYDPANFFSFHQSLQSTS